MEELKFLGPLIGVLVGAGLTGVTALLKERKEKKRIIAVALADLLEVRHRVVSVDLAISAIREQVVEIKPEQVPALRNLLDALFPLDAELNKRYDNAISLLAGIDPILGYRMRSKNVVPQLFTSLRAQAAASGADPGALELFEAQLRSVVIPYLNESVTELAKAHSFMTLRRVKALMARSVSLPPQIEKLFIQMKSENVAPDQAPPPAA